MVLRNASKSSSRWATPDMGMIDLHCHIVPGIDDGAADLASALAMAEAFVADGVEIVACTPHILPGLYPNEGPAIRAAIASLQAHISAAGLPLQLTTGADVHIAPSLVEGLRSGRVLSLGDTRYFLLEPPHHVVPVRFEETLFDLMLAGYVPIVTHPERLSWIDANYAVVQRLARQGVLMQLTSGSLTGKFGKSPVYWSERMLDEGLVHVLATDAHDPDRRCPDLKAGLERAAQLIGDEGAMALVDSIPRGILRNDEPAALLSTLRPQVEQFSGGDGAVGARTGGTNVAAVEGTRNSGAVRGLGRRLRELFE